MVLLKGIQLKPALPPIGYEVIDKIDVEVPVFALFATFIELDQHASRALVLLHHTRVTFKQR